LVFLGFQRQCIPAMAGYRLVGVGGNVLKLSRKNRDREVTIGEVASASLVGRAAGANTDSR